MVNFETACLKLHKYLHYIYLLYALPMVYLAATITPPFQNPDEPNHFLRAEQVSRFDLVPTFIHSRDSLPAKDLAPSDSRIVYPDKGGFATDKGLLAIQEKFYRISHNNKGKITRALLDSVQNIQWRTGTGYMNFGNTTLYPPVVYIMPAIGIAAGKLFHLSIIKTLYLSRILNGLFTVFLCFIALMLAKRSNILMFIVLLFPMTVALFASVSQDSIVISCAFLLIAIIDHTEFSDNKTYPKWHLPAMIVIMCIIAIAKPPYAPLALIFLFLKKLKPKARAISIIAPIISVLLWAIVNHANFAIKFAPPELRINAKLQVQHIVHHPLKFIGLFFKFDKDGINTVIHMFVGILGWLDVPFTSDYYHIAYGVLFAGLIIGLKATWKDDSSIKIGLLACTLTTLITVLTAQYVTWTALDAPFLGGMQGRYLLPISPFLALALVSTGPKHEKFARLKDIFFLLILLFPMYSTIMIISGLINRYYIG